MRGRNKIGFDEWAARAAEKGLVLKGLRYENNRARLFLECKKHGEFETKTLSTHTCKACGRESIRKKNQVSRNEFINKAILKHGNKFTYLNDEWQGVNGKVRVICPSHGEFETTGVAHLGSATGCVKCSLELPTKKIIKDGKRKCTKCGETKEIKHFPVYFRKKTSSYKMSSCCIDCKRRDDLIRSEHPDRKAKMIVAQKKAWQKRKEQNLVKWLEDNQGAFCVAHWHKCASCLKLTYFKHRGYNEAKCKMCIRVEQRIGAKMPRKTKHCVDCGTEYIGSTNAQYCDKCKHIRAKKHKGKQPSRHKIEQRAKAKGVHVQHVNRLLVYKRDKYTCYLCGCKVVRSKDYRPDQATLDHVIPLDKGGPHTYENVKTCCHKCNSEKGTASYVSYTSRPVQLSLFQR